MKIVKNFQLKIVFYTAVKNRCMLDGRVFVISMFWERAVRSAYQMFSSSQEIYNRVVLRCSKKSTLIFDEDSPPVKGPKPHIFTLSVACAVDRSKAVILE